MAKQDYLFRYLSIIRKLRSCGEATFLEIRNFLEKEAGYADKTLSLNIRTFQRDVREIAELFKIEISYDFSRKVYYISWDEHHDLNNRLIESMDMINALNIAHDIRRYMIFERRKSKGTQHFQPLLQAIRTRCVILLTHQKFDDDEPSKRQVAPYALKESGGRWYLVARDMDDRRIKTFGLDRIQQFVATARRFDYPQDFDIQAYFRYSFGVINPQDSPPEVVLLSFDSDQGKYIKSYPLHESQTVVVDNDHECIVKVVLWITYDLIQEIMSYGDRVNVLEPTSLKQTIRQIAERMTRNHAGL